MVVLLIVLSFLTALIPLMTDIGSYAHQLMYQQYAMEQKRYILDGLMQAGVLCCHTNKTGPFSIDEIPYQQGRVQGRVNVQPQGAGYKLNAQLLAQERVIGSASCMLEKQEKTITISQWNYDEV